MSPVSNMDYTFYISEEVESPIKYHDWEKPHKKGGFWLNFKVQYQVTLEIDMLGFEKWLQDF